MGKIMMPRAEGNSASAIDGKRLLRIAAGVDRP